jgi:serine/threonine protein kinase
MLSISNREFIRSLPKQILFIKYPDIQLFESYYENVFISPDRQFMIKTFSYDIHGKTKLSKKEIFKLNLLSEGLRSSFHVLVSTNIDDAFLSFHELFYDETIHKIVVVYHAIEGSNLLEWTPSEKETNEEDELLIQIMYQLLQNLNVLHEKLKLVHRDLKPDNIIIQKQNGKPILIDFDWSTNEEIFRTNTKNWPGTRLYAATCIINGERMTFAKWKRADIVSFALTFYRMITNDFETPLEEILVLAKEDNEPNRELLDFVLDFLKPLLRADIDYDVPLQTIIEQFKDQFIKIKEKE